MNINKLLNHTSTPSHNNIGSTSRFAQYHEDCKLTPDVVQDLWNTPCIDLTQNASRIAWKENTFLDARSRIRVENLEPFKGQLRWGSRLQLDTCGFLAEHVRYFAVYTQFMGINRAFIRLSPYTRDGLHVSDLDVILDLPRALNDVIFPSTLAVDAMNAIQFNPFTHVSIFRQARLDINIHQGTIDENIFEAGYLMYEEI